MKLRAVGVVLIAVGVFAALGFPTSVYLATRGLATDIERTPGLEVIERDLPSLRLFTGAGDDVAVLVVRTDEATSAKTVRDALSAAGFSATPTYTPFHGDETGYHDRTRNDSYDADLYRILDEDPGTGTVTIGLSFFDNDSMLFAPYALVVGLVLLWAGIRLLRDPLDAGGTATEAPTPASVPV
jgi:hypothetical protein